MLARSPIAPALMVLAALMAGAAHARVYEGSGTYQDCEGDPGGCLEDLDVRIVVFGAAPTLDVLIQSRTLGCPECPYALFLRALVTLSGAGFSGGDGFWEIDGSISCDAISVDGIDQEGLIFEVFSFTGRHVDDFGETDLVLPECGRGEEPERVRWGDPTGGDWNDGSRWDGGQTPDEHAEVSVAGSYTVAGAPIAPLISLLIGNPGGEITLAPGAEPFETERLIVQGDTAVSGGALEAGFADLADDVLDSIRIEAGARLTIGAGATLRAGPDVVDPSRVGDPLADGGSTLLTGDAAALRVEAGGVASVQDVIGDASASVEIAGAGSRLSTRLLELGFFSGASADLSVTGGGELRVGDALRLGMGPGRIASALVADAGSAVLGLRGDLLDTGPREIVIGDAGEGDLVVDGADLLLGRSLVLGKEGSAFGLLTVRNGGGLYASPTEITDITVGAAGVGILVIEPGAFLDFLGDPVSGPRPDLTLALTSTSGALVDFSGDGDPATVTRFENVVVGNGGGATWFLRDGAQVDAASLEVARDSSSALARLDVAGADTALRVSNGGGTGLGLGGDAILDVRDGATFTSRRLGPGEPFEAGQMFVGSESRGWASAFTVNTNATAELETLSVGELAARPTLSNFPFPSHAGSVQVVAGASLFATDRIRVGNEGSLSATVGTIETPLLTIGGANDGGPGARVELFTSMLQATAAIGIGTGVPATGSAQPVLRIEDGSNVLAGGLDARGPAQVVIDDSFARLDGPVAIGTQAPFPSGGSFVSVSVRGPSGALDASGHTIAIGDAGTCACQGVLEIAAGATAIADLFDVRDGGVLAGSARIQGPLAVASGGVVRPGSSPGTLAIEGDADFAPGSRLELEVGGTEASTQYDVLDVSGDLDFGGTLTLAFVDGFAPRRDDRFEFLRASGAADLAVQEVVVENLAPGFEYEIAATPAQLSVVARSDGIYVPEPGTTAGAGAALVALATLARERRRRLCFLRQS